jgi:hypothetical protein
VVVTELIEELQKFPSHWTVLVEYPVRQALRPMAEPSDLASIASVGVDTEIRSALHCTVVLNSLHGIR